MAATSFLDVDWSAHRSWPLEFTHICFCFLVESIVNTQAHTHTRAQRALLPVHLAPQRRSLKQFYDKREEGKKRSEWKSQSQVRLKDGKGYEQNPVAVKRLDKCAWLEARIQEIWGKCFLDSPCVFNLPNARWKRIGSRDDSEERLPSGGSISPRERPNLRQFGLWWVHWPLKISLGPGGSLS